MITEQRRRTVIDPLRFLKLGWPGVTLYKQQREIVYSVRDNDMTIVRAGNELGKDFVTAFICTWFTCSRNPVKVVTTSVDYTQLEAVLWGEIRRFIQLCRFKLPLQVNTLKIRKIVQGSIDPLSYLMGRVAAKGEGLLGHHVTPAAMSGMELGSTVPNYDDGIPRTLAVYDEASGIDDDSHVAMQSWAKRELMISNPNECHNFYFRYCKAGDLWSEEDGRFYRKLIHIGAEDSPNIRLARKEISEGKQPSGTQIIPGVKSWSRYQLHLKTWDPVRQCIGLHGDFYEGSDKLLYPSEWLNRSEMYAASLNVNRPGDSIGQDSAEGGDDTAMAVVDRKGLIALTAEKTPDTSDIPGEIVAFGRKHRVPADKWWLDRGGGGKQHADALRKLGHPVNTVAFGTPIKPALKRGSAQQPFTVRVDLEEERTVFKNLRAKMYWMVRELIEPETLPGGIIISRFGIPARFVELRRQMSLIPLKYDPNGAMYVPPKKRKDPHSTEVTLTEILGCSPDELDALVLAVYGMLHKPTKPVIGIHA